MAFCRNCGAEIDDHAVVCVKCGRSVKSAANDASSFGFALLGFFFPIVGLILYLVWKDSSPLKAKSAGKGALISVIVSVVSYMIYVIALAGIFSSIF